MDRIEIYTSKKKSILLLIGSIIFVVLGIWLFIDAYNVHVWIISNPIIIRGISIISILLFGFGIFIGIKRLIKSEIALIIDPIGLNLNPKKSLTEFIKWDDIFGFQEININGTKILIIDVKNPEYWLEKEASKLKKKLMKFNINNYGSPFNISSAGIDISSSELNKKLNRYFEEYKNEA